MMSSYCDLLGGYVTYICAITDDNVGRLSKTVPARFSDLKVFFPSL